MRFTLAGKMLIETIRQLQKEQTEKIARTEKEKLESLEIQRLSLLEGERRRKEIAEERRNFVIQKTQKILRDNGILDNLIKIENELLSGKVYGHEIFYKPEDCGVFLIWGSGFKYENGKVRTVGDKNGDYNFSMIEARVNPDEETLTICGAEQFKFSKDEYKNNKVVEESLAKAFVNPITYCYIRQFDLSDHRTTSSDD